MHLSPWGVSVSDTESATQLFCGSPEPAAPGAWWVKRTHRELKPCFAWAETILLAHPKVAKWLGLRRAIVPILDPHAQESLFFRAITLAERTGCDLVIAYKVSGLMFETSLDPLMMSQILSHEEDYKLRRCSQWIDRATRRGISVSLVPDSGTRSYSKFVCELICGQPQAALVADPYVFQSFLRRRMLKSVMARGHTLAIAFPKGSPVMTAAPATFAEAARDRVA